MTSNKLLSGLFCIALVSISYTFSVMATTLEASEGHDEVDNILKAIIEDGGLVYEQGPMDSLEEDESIEDDSMDDELDKTYHNRHSAISQRVFSRLDRSSRWTNNASHLGLSVPIRERIYKVGGHTLRSGRHGWSLDHGQPLCSMKLNDKNKKALDQLEVYFPDAVGQKVWLLVRNGDSKFPASILCDYAKRAGLLVDRKGEFQRDGMNEAYELVLLTRRSKVLTFEGDSCVRVPAAVSPSHELSAIEESDFE